MLRNKSVSIASILGPRTLRSLTGFAVVIHLVSISRSSSYDKRIYAYVVQASQCLLVIKPSCVCFPERLDQNLFIVRQGSHGHLCWDLLHRGGEGHEVVHSRHGV